MPKPSYAAELLHAAKLAAIKENDSLLVYLIEMAAERANSGASKDGKKSA